MKKLILIIPVLIAIVCSIGVSASKLEEQKYNDCVLSANKNYDEEIKRTGYITVIKGREYRGLDKSQWSSIEEQRNKDIRNCSKG